MSHKVEQRVSDLRERAAEFSNIMQQLHAVGPAVRSDKHARAEWQQLMLDGNAIKAAIMTSGRMIDGASKWVAKTFQRQALDAIPFAADVVHSATNGSISAIDHFLDRARVALEKFRPLRIAFEKLDKKEQQRLSAVEIETPKKSCVPGLLLIAILGGVVWWSQREPDCEPELAIFDMDD